ncbi:hypothetical protein BP6252_04697 [Coleophoma cylindrospora]|uniref:Chitin biosynthesis protein CHS5 n=1 Tax=Coleophoma cylindrospora TaxID=1849047 RepID=A0A3D8S189_9HELO|nr:hypothetical protein BP6252_04697 [Coleophoma cylindrospora]
MLISLTVGKVDAGVAVLLTQDKRLIEFPSILLPPNISSGSIVDITVARNLASETKSQNNFTKLQDLIYSSFGEAEPSSPVLRCKNATQTSVVLEWDPVELATADFISLSLFRNGQKAGSIPRHAQCTKISGLGVDTEYTFQLVLRTTAGTYSSEKVTVKTHKMTDLSGITVTPGILPAQLRDTLTAAIERIGGKMADTVRLDTTHFVTTEGRGLAWEKAVEMNIPVVRPEWVEGCERGGRIVGVRQYYLDADPRQRSVSVATASAEPPARKESTVAEPSAEQNGTNGSGSQVAPTPPAKDARQESEDSSSESEEEEPEESPEEKEKDKEPEKIAVPEEQKVRVEDRDMHNPALRPNAVPKEKEKELDEGPASGAQTPGNSSFQDVAL